MLNDQLLLFPVQALGPGQTYYIESKTRYIYVNMLLFWIKISIIYHRIYYQSI